MPAFTTGAIYKSVSPDGTVEYSDRPRKGSIKVEVRPLQTYTPPAPPKFEMFQPQAEKQQGMPSYHIAIVKPQEGATIHDNTGKVAVLVRLEPPLEMDSRYTLQLLLDGQKVGKLSPRGEYTLTGVERGTHALQARLLTPLGKVAAQTNPATFYMKRMSILFRPPANGKGQPGGVQRAPRAPQMPKMPGPPNAGGVPLP